MSKQNTPVVTKSYVSRLKQQAKSLAKSDNLALWKAQDTVAKNKGFSNWKGITSELKRLAFQSQITPKPSLRFTDDDDVTLSSADLKNLELERFEEPTASSKEAVSKNRSTLAKKGIEYSIFEPTQTGLNKSILDATQPVRTHFNLMAFHDYDAQLQQSALEDNKVIK